MVWSGPPFSDAPPIVLSWAEHRVAGHVALALLSMTDGTYGGRRGLVALDAGGGRYVQVRGGDDAFELAAADGSFAEPPFRLNRAQRQAMRRLRWDPLGPAPSHYVMTVRPPVLDMRPLANLLLDTLVRGLGVEPAAPVRLQLWRHKRDERGRSLLADTLPAPSTDLGRWRPDMNGFQVEGLLNADLSGLLPFVLLTHDGPTYAGGFQPHKPALYHLVRHPPDGGLAEHYGEGFLLPLAVAASSVRDVLMPICAEIDALTDETTVARRRRAARLLGRARVDGVPLGFRVIDGAPARGFVELAPSPALFQRLRASFAMASGLGTTTRHPIRLKSYAPFRSAVPPTPWSGCGTTAAGRGTRSAPTWSLGRCRTWPRSAACARRARSRQRRTWTLYRGSSRGGASPRWTCGLSKSATASRGASWAPGVNAWPSTRTPIPPPWRTSCCG